MVSASDGGGGVVGDGTTQDRAVRLFEFLRELQRLRTRVVRSLNGYREVLWLSELPDLPEVRSRHRDDTSDAWLTIDRVDRKAPPSLPAPLRPWVSAAALRDSRPDDPGLSPRAIGTREVMEPDGSRATVTEELLLEDHPDVRRAYDAWLPTWTAWAIEDRRVAAVSQAYEKLYAVYQDSRALAETYEALLGFGLLITNSGGQEVRRHLVTAKVVVELDLETGRLTVLPSPDASAPALEQDMLDPADTVPDEVRHAVLDGLSGLDDPWAPDPDGVSTVLRTWVNGLNAQASYLHQANPQVPRREDGPTVSLAPALILRERNRGSFIAACDEIVGLLKRGNDVPAGVRQFVDITDGTVSEQDREHWSAKYADTEVYFPKPANEDQRQIVERLSGRQTVVVQGPPGTGKTHTIANLVTDLLAHGQRVLITSHTPRALSVLKGQLPDEIRELCVSVTGDAVKGQADLEHSVNTILSRADSYNPIAARREEESLRGALATARATIAQAFAELRSIREHETYVYAPEIGDYQGTLQQIAARLADEQERFAWIGSVPREECVLEPGDALEYLRLLRAATAEVRSRAGRIVDVDVLPTPAEFIALAQRRTELQENAEDLQALLDESRFRVLGKTSDANAAGLRLALDDIVRRRHELERRSEDWLRRSLDDVLSGRGRALHAQHQSTADACALADSLLNVLDGQLVTGLSTLDLGVALGQVNALIGHLESGRKLKGLFGAPKVVKESANVLDRLRVDGQRPDTLLRLQAARAKIQLENTLRPVEQTWSLADASDIPASQRVAQLRDEAAVLFQLLEFAESLEYSRKMLNGLGVLVDPTQPNEVTDCSRALDGLKIAVLQADILSKIAPAVAALAAVRNGAPPVAEAAAAMAGWDIDGYASSFTKLMAVGDANLVLAQLAEARRPFDASAPALAKALEVDHAFEHWDKMLPHLREAWAWSAWDARVRAKTDPRAEQHWRTFLSDAEVDERSALRRLASNRGWSSCLERLTPHESTHLNMYAQAVRKAGKGTGKYVHRHRANARDSLQQCQSAVPAWIMPMHQVFETVPVNQPDLFDVVIVDEASQSGLEGVMLSWLAPRMVIVGDDKQVSPSNVGLDHEAVYTLQDRYLSGLETKSLFGPTSSFFDQAVTMSRSRITLKEHFRCMPEIIGFSNEMSYRGELVPLRQYGADRLPPLRTTFVRGAVVSGRRDVVNEAEAQALVDQIAKCCSDPAYDGKDMGVLTLLGGTQDKLIMSRLIETLGVREIEERRLRAGNAEAFQGDERHVMFISMVSSLHSTEGPARIGVLSKDSDQQRLNVAASRARDQVWLFHSVQPGDLSSKDLRRRYLQYVSRPALEQDGLDIGEVSPNERHESFDSLFEQRVFLALRARGYRVRPQYKVGHYRIDLVVEGGTRRLAIECDGDAFHGVDAHEDDAARQRDLERVGWTFWRVRGSAFFRDPVDALEPLWALLDKFEIQPEGSQHEIEDSLQSEVEAPPAAVSEVRPELPKEPAAPRATLPVPSHSLQTQIPTPQTTQVPPIDEASATPVAPRFRNGKMLLTSAAHARVRDEVASIEAWLADPPEAIGVDARSLDVAQAKQKALTIELQDRLDYLSRVLKESAPDPEHHGGAWVTPGCLFALRFDDDQTPETSAVSSMDVGDAETTIRPFTDLGRALDGVEVGAVVRYEAGNTPRTATVVSVLD